METTIDTARKTHPLVSPKLGMKLFMDGGRIPEADRIVLTFDQWIRQRAFATERLIDVCSYVHSLHGPWVMLIGSDAMWIVDAKHGEPGLRYTTRKCRADRWRRPERTPRSRLRETYAAVLTAARLFQIDLGVTFRTDVVEIEVADRLVAPNTPETFRAVEDDIRAFGREVFDEPRLLPMNAGSPESFFRVRVEGTRRARLDDLIARLDQLSRTGRV